MCSWNIPIIWCCSFSLTIIHDLSLQAYVPHVPGEVIWAGSYVWLYVDDGLRSVWWQEVPLQLPQFELGGGGQGGPLYAREDPCSPRLTHQGSTMDEADCVLWQTQTDQSSDGWQWPCKSNSWFILIIRIVCSTLNNWQNVSNWITL